MSKEYNIFAHRLQAGYVYNPNGEVYPLEWCDFELYEHGEKGRPPTDHSFSFKAGMCNTSPKLLKTQYSEPSTKWTNRGKGVSINDESVKCKF